jgi:hypothetical protein
LLLGQLRGKGGRIYLRKGDSMDYEEIVKKLSEVKGTVTIKDGVAWLENGESLRLRQPTVEELTSVLFDLCSSLEQEGGEYDIQSDSARVSGYVAMNTILKVNSLLGDDIL